MLRAHLDLRNFAVGSGWITFGQIVTQVTGVVTSIVIARWLGPEGLGELGITRDIAVLIVPIATLGISQMLTRQIGRSINGDNASEEISGLLTLLVWFAAIASILSSTILLFIAMPVERYMDTPGLHELIQVLALVVFISVSYELVNAVAIGLQEFKALSVRQVLSAILSPVVTLTFMYFWGVKGVILSSGLVNLLLLVFLLKFLIRGPVNRYQLRFTRPDLSGLNQLVRKSLPLLGSMALMRPMGLVGSSTLLIYASLTELGLFRVALTFYGFALIVPSVFQMVLLPMFSRIKDPELIAQQGVLIVRLIMVLSVPFFVFAIFAAEPVTTLLYGEEYLGAGSLVALMLLTSFIAMIAMLMETNLISQGRTSRQFSINVINFIVFISLSQFLIPSYVQWGLVLTYLGTAIVALLSYLLVFRKSQAATSGALYMPVIVSSVVVSTAYGYSVTGFSWGVAAVFIVLAALISLLVLSRKDRKLLRSMVMGEPR